MKPFTKKEIRRIADNSNLAPFTSQQSTLHHAAAQALFEDAKKMGCNGNALLLASTAFSLGRATGIREERARRHKMMKTYRGNAAERI